MVVFLVNPTPIVYKNPMTNLYRKSTPKAFFILLALCLGLSSCLTTGRQAEEKQRVFKLGQHKTWLEQPNSSDPFFKDRKFNHPFRLKPEVLEEQLRSFQYKGLALLSKTRKVFPEPVEKQIISLILIALDKARPEEIVKFAYNQKGVGATSGDVFITGNKIHWRFQEISGKEYSVHGSRDWLDSWKLVLDKDQKFHGSKGLMGASPARNWIIMPVEASEASAPPPSVLEEGKEEAAEATDDETLPARKVIREKPAPASGGDEELEKALSRLKKLREKDLITEEDYNKKKKELLEKGFSF